MNIKIGEYQIESDSLQFIVKERKIKQDGEKKGEEYFVNKAYCCKFEDVLKFVCDDVLRSNDDISIIMDKLTQIQADIQALEYKPVVIINTPIKIPEKLYHVVANKIIEIEVTNIEYNENGIYVYGKNKSNEPYRFIYKTYGEIKKTHFDKEVFTNKEDAEKNINEKEKGEEE